MIVYSINYDLFMLVHKSSDSIIQQKFFMCILIELQSNWYIQSNSNSQWVACVVTIIDSIVYIL